jgi:hypothetical protein
MGIIAVEGVEEKSDTIGNSSLEKAEKFGETGLLGL